MIAQRQKQEEIEAQASARASAPLTDRQIATLKVLAMCGFARRGSNRMSMENLSMDGIARGLD